MSWRKSTDKTRFCAIEWRILQSGLFQATSTKEVKWTNLEIKRNSFHDILASRDVVIEFTDLLKYVMKETLSDYNNPEVSLIEICSGPFGRNTFKTLDWQIDGGIFDQLTERNFKKRSKFKRPYLTEMLDGVMILSFTVKRKRKNE